MSPNEPHFARCQSSANTFPKPQPPFIPASAPHPPVNLSSHETRISLAQRTSKKRFTSWNYRPNEGNQKGISGRFASPVVVEISNSCTGFPTNAHPMYHGPFDQPLNTQLPKGTRNKSLSFWGHDQKLTKSGKPNGDFRSIRCGQLRNSLLLVLRE